MRLTAARMIQVGHCVGGFVSWAGKARTRATAFAMAVSSFLPSAGTVYITGLGPAVRSVILSPGFKSSVNVESGTLFASRRVTRNVQLINGAF